jgi:hypothetical protein
MKPQWDSRRTTREANFDTLSTHSSWSIRSRLQNVIPSGTVASRIYFLQRLANPASAEPPPTVSYRRRESSRTGFGRSMNGQFAQSASRCTKPVEQTKFDTTHSFLGLCIPRTNHEEEHAIGGAIIKGSQKATLPRQIQTTRGYGKEAV